MSKPFFQETKDDVLRNIKTLKDRLNRLENRINDLEEGQEDVIFSFLVDGVSESSMKIIYGVGAMNGAAMKQYER